MDIINLKYIIIRYLRDAGFDRNKYQMSESTLNYVEIFFDNSEAVYYIIEDIKKTKYNNEIEILDYKYNIGKITAIITCKETV